MVRVGSTLLYGQLRPAMLRHLPVRVTMGSARAGPIHDVKERANNFSKTTYEIFFRLGRACGAPEPDV